MKKLVLTFAALMALTAMNAQETESSAQTRFGIKAGVNIATLDGDVEASGSRTGLHAGFVAEIMVSDKFSIQPEVLYSMLGAKEKAAEMVDGVLVTAEGTYKFDYIAIPVMAKYYVTEGLSLEAGPQISFLVSAKVEVEGNYGGVDVTTEEEMKDVIKSTDFGFNVGLGYELPMGLFFQGRYTAGLSNIYDGEGDGDIRNGVAQISVGYKF